jgi:hypothetical protein
MSKRIKRDQPHAIVVSFFFDARGTLLERTTLGLFRSLIADLFDQIPDLVDQFIPVFRNMVSRREGGYRLEDLQDWIQRLLSTLEVEALYLFVDALDECDGEFQGEPSARRLVRFLEDLMLSHSSTQSPFLLCLSSRHYPHISVRHDIAVCQLIMEQGNSPDIRHFTMSYLQRESSQSNDIDEGLLEDIAKKSKGIFLWVVLVVRALQVA